MKTFLSVTEENYLKAIFKLSEKKTDAVGTNDIAVEISTTAASVSDMLRKLAEKKLVKYEKYRGVNLTIKGRKIAVALIRKHRLWEVFLSEKLDFNWDEIHDIAEELEHISSPLLVERLDKFLNHPKFDPHGDPIPDSDGNIAYHEEMNLEHLMKAEKGIIVGVAEQSAAFLQFLDKNNINIGSRFEVAEHHEYDNSKTIHVEGKQTIFISEKAAKNLIVKKL